MAGHPVLAVTAHEPAPAEELEDVVAALQDLAFEGFATAHEIAHAFLCLGRDVDRRELTGGVEPSALDGVTLVVLPRVTSLDGVSEGAMRSHAYPRAASERWMPTHRIGRAMGLVSGGCGRGRIWLWRCADT